jgi:methyl-accepting chemotaxis protein
VEASYRQSIEYRAFWEKLGRGEFDAGKYLRLGKGGKEIWIQASYNPILDGNGKPFMVVKYATDVTEQMKLSAQMELTVQEASQIAAAAAAGDLTRRISLVGKTGALEGLSAGVNQLLCVMADVISKVKEAAVEVSRGADEISQGNTNLSQRTEEQASSLEETASSMEEMTSTVKQNADNAGQANQLAVAARDQAEKGGAVVARAVRAMTDINDASKKIADIIGVIDEIAFQTNLLALNAAVEAARAGEQGRGFAVVASEVRNLASRSATAAKEIKTLIQDSVRKVDEGSSLVTQSGATLEQIVAAVKRVTDIVAEISAASNEQSSGIEQVNKAVMQLDELTQQNAALVEEASAASQSMAEQARGLNASMQRYRVLGGTAREAGGASVARPAAEARPATADRRKPGRPWNAGKTAPAREAASARTASSGGDEAVWKEF